MKRVFIYWGPHLLHWEWGQLVCDKSVAIIPRFLPHSWRFITPITQFFSVLSALYTPRADTYFLEGFNCIIPAWLHKRKGTKIIMINSDTTFIVSKDWRGIKQWLFRKLLPSVDGMISTSTYIKEIADKAHKVPNYVVNPYVGAKFFNVKSRGGNNLIQIGGLRDGKGTDLLLKTFDLVRKKLHNKLICAGPVLEKQYAKAYQDNHITVTGWTDKPEIFLAQAGYYVNLSRHDSFGVSVLEAMAAGVIPIVSEQCGAKDVVRQLDTGLIVPLDPKRAAQAILSLEKNPKKKQELSVKGRILAKTYTREKCMKQFLLAFTKLEEEMHA